MGWDGMAFAQSGISFAWVVYNYQRKPVNWRKIDALLDTVR
jgi:hypothetical protein